MSEILLAHVMEDSFNLFKERLDQVPDFMAELIRPLDKSYNEHNSIIALLCAYSYYSPDAQTMEKQQFQKFEYMLEKIAEIKAQDTGKFLNEFVGETNGCTIYMQCAMYNHQGKMKLLCEYGYDPTFVHTDKEGNPVPFEWVVSAYGGKTLDDIVSFNNELCVIYNKDKLENQLVDKKTVKQKKI